ncbi:MAG: hypothetical protein R2731_14785 [Nocardioides sp.]
MTAAALPVPRPLRLAAWLSAAEGVALLAGDAEAGVDRTCALMGTTTTLFFAGYAAALLGCARALTRSRAWARSPLACWRS